MNKNTNNPTNTSTNTSTNKNKNLPINTKTDKDTPTNTSKNKNILNNQRKNITTLLKTELSTQKNITNLLKTELDTQKNITTLLKTELSTIPNNKKFKSNNICLINNLELLKNNKTFPKFEYEGPDGFKCVKFLLNRGESIRADGGSMNYMSSNIKIKTKSGSNIFGAFGRILSGSTFFYNIFYNDNDKPAEINFSGAIPGNIGCFYIPKGKKLSLVNDAYICSTSNIEITTNVRFGGFLLGYGLTFVDINSNSGDGLLWTASFGNIIEKKLQPYESIKVDNGILFGFEENIELSTTTVGGLKSTLFSDEGFVSEIRNNNNFEVRIFLQSRSETSYIKYLKKYSK